jgi:capsular exopolysaccharide synthesis family protein
MRVQTAPQEADSLLDQRSNADADSPSALSLGDIAQMLGRHKWFIVACIVICTTIAAIYVRSVTPIYEAIASIRIDPGRIGSLGLADLTSGPSDSGEMIATEMAIVKSDAVALDTLNSLSDDEFRQYTHAERKTLGIRPGSTSLSPAQEGMLAHFKSQITVTQVPGTQLVSITLRDPNPRIAALLVNHLIQAYLRQNFDSRYGSVAQVTTWLSAEMNSLNQRAGQAQQKLADFQEKNHILAFGGGGGGGESVSEKGGGGGGGGGSASSTVTDRLTALQSRLIEAQADRIVKEAQMRSAATGDTAVLSALYPSANLTGLQSQQATLYGQYVQLSTKFGANYPPLAEVKTQMQKTDAEFQRQIATVRSRLKQEYDTTATVEHLLQTQVDEQTEKAYSLNRKAAEYAVLLAEGTSSRELYNTLQYKLQQASVDAGLNNVNTMLVDTARAPLVPVEPKKTVIMSFGLVLGLFTGVGAVFLREATSDRVRGIEQIERTLHYHLLATIPNISLDRGVQRDVTALVSREVSPMLVAFTEPLSVASEGFRTLRNSVLLSSIDKPARTVLVSSTIPGEGKSSVSSNYGIVLAQKGARVLIVDADLRRPTLHALFGVKNEEGLSDFILNDNVSPPFYNPISTLPNLFLLTAGSKVPLPSEALGSAKFHSLLTYWEQAFDYVIIDSAPLLVVSDSLPLASWVDSLILVTRYNLTPIAALKRIRGILQHTNAHVAGVVINDMSVADSAYYGGYGGGYYN